MKRKLIRYSLVLFFIQLLYLSTTTIYGGTYQDQILFYLNEGLTKPNNYIHNSYSLLYDYLEKQNRIPQFQEYSRAQNWKLVFFKDETGYRRIELNKTKLAVTELPLYSVMQDSTATLASFWDLEDENYQKLPPYLKKYYLLLKNQPSKSEDPFENNEKNIPVVKLAKDLPEILKKNYWLVSPSNAVRGEIDSLNCTTQVMYGQFHIEIKFKPGLKNPLFAFEAAADNQIPRILPIDNKNSPLIPSVLKRSKVVIALVNKEKNIFFIGSIANTFSEFYMLWDGTKQKILYLTLALGYSLGNDALEYTDTCLLQYQDRIYLMRTSKTRLKSEIIYFSDNALQPITHADYMAPDL